MSDTTDKPDGLTAAMLLAQALIVEASWLQFIECSCGNLQPVGKKGMKIECESCGREIVPPGVTV